MYGGATLTPESVAAIQPSEKKMTGSMLLYEAESIDTVREIVEKDVYYVNNVVRCNALLCRVRQPSFSPVGYKEHRNRAVRWSYALASELGRSR